jgi:hypothetical protein
MTWTKHFRTVKVNQSPVPTQPNPNNSRSTGSGAKYSSYLPEVYAGHPNRLQRYMQYDDMDRDSEINASLDTIADFCTQSEEQTEAPFAVRYDETANETEVKIIKQTLNKWIRLNDFRSRLWYMFRGVIKNGDQFFVRDPETREWIWVDHYKVELVKVDEASGRKPVEYVIRGLDYINQDKLGTKPTDPADYQGSSSTMSPLTRGPVSGGNSGSDFQLAGAGQSQSNQNADANRSVSVDAKHVIHLSLSVGMDVSWPFGSSVLESIFKTFKQKELLEDSVIIYRVQRAPERRIFKIDVGGMNPMLANAHIERIKNEIHQRRIPNRSGGGSSIMDAAYNPLSMMEDYFFAQGLDGRGSSVETLPGGDQLGEITDLEFFNKKLRAGLRIPPAYMAGGDGDQGASYNDGKIGAALIQEYKFNKYCMRLQSLLTPVFDKEFKDFLKDSGVNIDNDLFELQFNPPQNFTKYRQVELDTAQMSVYTQIQDNKKLSERFKLKRYLNLTEEEMLENERLWMEENPEKVKKATGNTASDTAGGEGLSSVGVGGGDDPFADEEGGDEGDGAEGDEGSEGGDEGGDDAAAPSEDDLF